MHVLGTAARPQRDLAAAMARTQVFTSYVHNCVKGGECAACAANPRRCDRMKACCRVHLGAAQAIYRGLAVSVCLSLQVATASSLSSHWAARRSCCSYSMSTPRADPPPTLGRDARLHGVTAMPFGARGRGSNEETSNFLTYSEFGMIRKSEPSDEPALR
jgi:hypothetical protein